METPVTDRGSEPENRRAGFLRSTLLERLHWKSKGAVVAPRIRILAAANSEDMLSAVRSACARCEIVEQVTDGWEMIRAAEQCSPDLIVAELEMEGLDGIEATARLIRSHPEARVIIVASDDPRELIEEAFEAGARAYVLAGQLARDIMLAVNAAMTGSRFVSQSGE